jgi:hypothetical protein
MKIIKYLLKAASVTLVLLLAMQSCEQTNVEENIVFKVSQDKFSVGKDGGSLSFTVSSPSAWEISSNSGWMSTNPRGGNAGPSNKVTLTVEPNTTAERREGVLTVEAGSQGQKIFVTVTQKGAGTDGGGDDGGGGGSVSSVNEWILSTLRENYLWNEDIKAVRNPNMSLPYTDFLSMLVRQADGKDDDGTMDGFLYNGTRYVYSYIEEVPTYTRVAMDKFHLPTYGFGVAGWWVARNTKIACFVTWVMKDSPADKAGLKRGMWIDKFNGKSMANNNDYQAFVNAWHYNVAVGSTLSIGTDTGLSATLTAEVMETTPFIIPPKVIEVGGKKIGYLFYNEFTDGTNNQFDNELRNYFATTLKGVDELVVDLRYNGGGLVNSCEILCALISGAVSPQIFVKLAYNDRNSETNPTNAEIWRYTKENNALTNLSRVFVLTTDDAASASELVINSLRGIENDAWVIQIGETTNGKNVGMNQFIETIDGVKYEMWPITFKSHNAKGFADYAGGFTPNYEVPDVDPDWYASTTKGKYDLGDPNEPLLKKALDIIAGNTTRAEQPRSSIDRSKMLEKPATQRGGLKIRAPREQPAEQN